MSWDPCAETSVLLGQVKRPMCRGECHVSSGRKPCVQRWVSCKVKKKGLFSKTGLQVQTDGDSQAFMEGSRDKRCRQVKDRRSLPKSCKQGLWNIGKDTNLLSQVTIVLKCFSATSEQKYSDWLSVDKMYEFERIFWLVQLGYVFLVFDWFNLDTF